MTILPENLDYTDKDFAALRARIINLIRGAYPDWTEFEVANFGTILLESFAFVGDVLTAYQDNQARESRLTTSNLRRSVLALAKMLGYAPSTAAPATAEVLFTLAAVPANDVLLPAGTIVRTKDVVGAVRFQLLVDRTIPAGADPPQTFGTVENSSTVNDESYQSNGLPGQSFTLAQTPYIDNTAVVVAANGVYSQVDNFLSSSGTDRHYTVTVDESDRAALRFGDGVSGAVPVGQITVDYKVGGGKAGNVDENTIQVIEGQFSDALGDAVTVTVRNPGKASGGENRESVAQIKQNAPANLRVSDRTVALEDYVIGAEEVAGVARALMVTSDQLPGLPENRGRLYIVPVGGGLPSDALKAQVLNKVTVARPKTITFQLTVMDPSYLVVDVACTVFLTADASASLVGAAIRSRLADFFAIDNPDGTRNTSIDFGLNYPTGRSGDQTPELPLSDIKNVVRDTAGVRKLGDRQVDFTLNGVSGDLAVAATAFPLLGSVSITDGDTGAPL